MSSRRKKSNERNNLIAGGVVLAAAVAAIGYVGVRSINVPVPDELGCYAELDQRTTAVWIDPSGPRFDADQIRSLKNYFLDKLDIGFNERLDVYTSEKDVQTSIMQPRFSACGYARNGQELVDAGLEPVQLGYLKRQREKQRKEILEPEFSAIFTANPDPSRLQEFQSPVLESFYGIAWNGLESGDRLIAVTDLLQNTESGRFCTVQGDMPRFEAFKEREVYERLKPRSLEGVEVTVLMLIREGYGQAELPYCSSEEELKTFFSAYFADNGASVEFIRLRQGIGDL